MRLTTDRLIIRDWHPLNDAQQACDIYGDPRVTRWLSNSAADSSIWITQQRLQRYCERTARLGIWAVVETAIDRAIGSILLISLPNSDKTDSDKIEIGWHFRPASWGYGYATEAATCGTKMRSEEHTSELQSPVPISYAVFCLKKKKK